MKQIPFPPSFLPLLAVLVAANASGATALSPLTSFGNALDGSLQPAGSDPAPYPWMDTGNNQRGYSRDPITGRLVLVNTATGSGGSAAVQGCIWILDGTTGAILGTLNTNGMGGGNYADAGTGVADDGVVYVANQVVSSGSNPFILYRWDSVTSTSPPLMVFSNTITPSQRYGNSMDVRGAGTGTQIIIGSQVSSSSGTNVVIFTTTDGTNFTAHVLGADTGLASFSDGLAFGSGNTFWAKKLGAPLRLMSFDLANNVATTLHSYDETSLPFSANFSPLAVDPANKLLAAIEVFSGSTGSERVWVFDISDTNRGPVLQDIKSFTPNNANASAPPGYLDFGGGNLYGHVINNGLMTWSVSTVTPAAPTFMAQPAVSNRIVTAGSLTLTALAYPDASYQWQRSSTDLPGATNMTYTITNAQVADTGVYRVVASNAGGATPSDSAYVAVVNLADLYHLETLWSVSPTAGQPYVNYGGSSGTPNQRTIAYNALSNELYIVSRAAPSGVNSSTYTIYAIAATNFSATPPPVLKTLNVDTNIINGGNIWLCAIGVAEDGALYACNSTTAALGPFKLYRWANSDSNTAPQVVYTGDPTGGGPYRWGDAMDVRGSGANTEIILDNNEVGATRYVAVLKPTDAYATNFTATFGVYNSTEGFGSLIGRSIQWGSRTVGDTTFYQDRSANATAAANYVTPLVRAGWNYLGGPGIVTIQNAYSNTFVSSTLGPTRLDLTQKVMVGVRTNGPSSSPPHSLELYELGNLSAPLLIAGYPFPASPPNPNANFIGQSIVANDYIFTLAANNGLMAFKLVSGPPMPPAFQTQPRGLRLAEGSSGTLMASANQMASYQWQKNGADIAGATTTTYTINPAQLSDTGDYRVIATNQFGKGTSDVAVVTVTPTNELYRLVQTWSASPLDGPVYVTSTGGANTPNERAIGFNTLSNQLLVVQRDGASAGSTYSIHVVDGSTGGWLHALKTGTTIVNTVTSEVSGQNGVGLVAIGVADDGAVYACNLSPNASGGSNPYDANKLFRVYRWADTDPNTAPTEIFTGDPAGQAANHRWGDTLRVRGDGMNTEILLDSKDGTFAAILRPTDGSLATFTNFWWATSSGDGTIGRSLQFGNGTSHWRKHRGAALMFSTFDTGTHTSVLVTNYGNFPATVAGVEVDTARGIAVGVDYIGVAGVSPDAVALFDIADPSQPMLVARYSFPANYNANNNSIGNTIIAGNRVFSLDGNNGIVAFDLAAPVPAVIPKLSIAASETEIVLSWTNVAGFTLQSSPVINPPAWTNAGNGTLVGNEYRATEPAAAASRFYRLLK